jgi:hypothetical protein
MRSVRPQMVDLRGFHSRNFDLQWHICKADSAVYY